jgi:hypothetical protein
MHIQNIFKSTVLLLVSNQAHPDLLFVVLGVVLNVNTDDFLCMLC